MGGLPCLELSIPSRPAHSKTFGTSTPLGSWQVFAAEVRQKGAPPVTGVWQMGWSSSYFIHSAPIHSHWVPRMDLPSDAPSSKFREKTDARVFYLVAFLLRS